MKTTDKLKVQSWRAIMGTDAVPADENEFLKALYGDMLSDAGSTPAASTIFTLSTQGVFRSHLVRLRQLSTAHAGTGPSSKRIALSTALGLKYM